MASGSVDVICVDDHNYAIRVTYNGVTVYGTVGADGAVAVAEAQRIYYQMVADRQDLR